MNNNFTLTSENQSMIIMAGFKETRRTEVITLGETYMIRPLNARKTKFDREACTVLKFLDPKPGQLPYAALVFLHHTKRRAQVELVDLASISKHHRRVTRPS